MLGRLNENIHIEHSALCLEYSKTKQWEKILLFRTCETEVGRNLLDVNMLILETERQFLEYVASYILSKSYGQARPLLPTIFAFIGEEWSKLPVSLGDFRTLCCMEFVGVSVCFIHRYLLTFVYRTLWHLGYRDKKTGSFPSRNSCSIEVQTLKQMIIIPCSRDVKRRLFQAKEQHLWQVLHAPGLVISVSH